MPGIWDETKYQFFPEIELWHENHRNDWQLANTRLASWLDALKSQGMNWVVWLTWNKKRENLEAKNITVNPKKIAAEKEGDSLILTPNQLQSEDQLINTLVGQIEKYASIVDLLGK